MILDTNAVSHLACKNLALAQLVDTSDRAVLSFIAVAEYRFGLLGSTRPQAGQDILNGLLTILPLLLPDTGTIDEYAKLAHQQKKLGRPIPSNDLWIAALARQHDLPILTQDRHFDFIPDIKRISW